jgi:hemerythrin
MSPIDTANPHADLSVGIPEIDDEHRHFFALIRRLDEALAGDAGAAAIQQLMELLVDDANRHFAHEEVMFGLVGFPDIEEHVKIHADLTSEINRLKQDFNAGHAHGEWSKWVEQIKDLLLHHVLEQDMKYRDFLHYHRLVPR